MTDEQQPQWQIPAIDPPPPSPPRNVEPVPLQAVRSGTAEGDLPKAPLWPLWWAPPGPMYPNPREFAPARNWPPEGERSA